ncbi:MAG: type II secretion system protein [Phycisphaerae bacterium]|jgi:prepilin-type N-terminal cleavage/methylation domain-containing protein/prepilin-type processing-associated H-X9-DG protein
MNRQGFTLTESVLVCAIISLLTAIVFPVLNTSRQKAQNILCESNIRQLNLAILMYANSNRESLPYGFVDSNTEPPGGFPGNLIYNKKGWWWFNYTGRFHSKAWKKKNILECPAKKLRDGSLKSNILCGNYGVNQSICKSFFAGGSDSNKEEFTNRPLTLIKVSRPGETLLIADSGYALINWWHATLTPPYPLNPMFIEDTSFVPGMEINSQKAVWPGQEDDALQGRHLNKTVNVGFVDGHIENVKADKLLVEKIGEQYKNLWPLWSPR